MQPSFHLGQSAGRETPEKLLTEAVTLRAGEVGANPLPGSIVYFFGAPKESGETTLAQMRSLRASQ